MVQYAPGTTHVKSYLEARKCGPIVFHGISYIIENYLKDITIDIAGISRVAKNMGIDLSDEQIGKLRELRAYISDKGKLPISIKGVKEGESYNARVPLLTIENIEPGFHWVVGYIESLLLKVWYPSSVSALSKQYRDIASKYWEMAGAPNIVLPYAVHDFGYRGCSSEETAILGGLSHLLFFSGSDNVPACTAAINDTSGKYNIPASISATEHSVMCSYGEGNDYEAFSRMLDLYKDQPVSVVADTWDYWGVLDNVLPRLKDRILERDHVFVIRPDSGNPEEVIPESFEKLFNTFGYTTNEKGYKVLPRQVRLIFGEAMYPERYDRVLSDMIDKGWCPSNLVIGVGGIMLNNHSRDDHGFAIKACRAKINGHWVDIFKKPKTDLSKVSKAGDVVIAEAVNYY